MAVWFNNKRPYSTFPLFFIWGIWRLRNSVLFEDFSPSIVRARSFKLHFLSDVPVQQRQIETFLFSSVGNWPALGISMGQPYVVLVAQGVC